MGIEQAWYMNPAFSVLVGGILPFGAVFIELFFILTSHVAPPVLLPLWVPVLSLRHPYHHLR